MAKIKILSDIVINKIAAGEVIERPASVVKELAENSLDAGATSITIEVENGGRRLIRVSDNGTGMGQDDALLAIERHATSKLKNAEDISNIITLGFRGEALPSIAAVSKTTINTKQESDEFGCQVIIEGGIIKSVKNVGRDTGTDVEIKNLFYNMPARRKFLRSDESEFRYIKNVIYDIVMSSPYLSMSFYNNGKEVVNFKSCNSKDERINQIYGDTLSSTMIKFSFEFEDISLDGYIGKPDSARNSAGNQYLILNGRNIRSKTILKAVIDGYGPALVKGMYPPLALYIKADPTRVDVNVHPTKREIKIYREREFLEALTDNVMKTLRSIISVPDVSLSNPIEMERRIPDGGIKFNSSVQPSYSGFSYESSNVPEEQQYVIGLDYENNRKAVIKDNKTSNDISAKDDYDGPNFWQFKDSYIVTSIKEGMMIIDQHAAHERILYEQFLANFKGKESPSQQLLFPIVLDFSSSDYDVLQPMIPFLEKIGYGISEFGERTIKIDAVPSIQNGLASPSIIIEYIDEMKVHGKVTSGYVEKIAAALACRSAIKAGTPMNQTEMQYITDRLFASSLPFNCPHRRPAIIKLPLEEIEKRFLR